MSVSPAACVGFGKRRYLNERSTNIGYRTSVSSQLLKGIRPLATGFPPPPEGGGPQPEALMDRDQARTDYRRILAGVVRHHQALDRHVTGASTARIAKRLGLRVKGGVIEADD